MSNQPKNNIGPIFTEPWVEADAALDLIEISEEIEVLAIIIKVKGEDMYIEDVKTRPDLMRKLLEILI